MRIALFIFGLGLAAALAAPQAAVPDASALTALKMLPRAALPNIALIEGYEGQPAPERWHILAYDAKEPTGVHEYVVAGGELVASRPISQFAETLRPEDVMGDAAVKIDSDRVGHLAQEYAKANQLVVAAYNFELRKEGAEAVPIWRVSCLDAHGVSVASLAVTATKGSVISHAGFAVEPAEPKPVEAHHAPEVHKSATPAPRVAEAAPVPVPMATPLPDEGLMRRAGGSLQKIFTGR